MVQFRAEKMKKMQQQEITNITLTNKIYETYNRCRERKIFYGKQISHFSLVETRKLTKRSYNTKVNV